MKHETFKSLKVGDVVTVRTVDEIKALKKVEVLPDGDIHVKDNKTTSDFFVLSLNPFSCEERTMDEFSGEKLEVDFVSASRVALKGSNWNFTRKMLREEVEKK